MTETVLQLNPADILAENNIRLNLRATDVERMCESIVDVGGVQQPVSVVLNGHGKYRLLSGFIRHAAVSKLNESGAGLTLPAIVSDAADETAQLKAQVAENVARASMSPIDTAIAIKRLQEQNVSMNDIRRIFADTSGKKLKVKSRGWVHIMLKLLDMPKGIQRRVHEGSLSYAAAYELGKVPADKREAVLMAAEEALERQTKREEADDARLLKEEQKEAKQAEKEQAEKDKLSALETAVKDAEKTAAAADAVFKTKKAAWETVKKVNYDPNDAAKAKEWKESVAASEKEYRTAQGEARKAVNKLADAKSAVSKFKDKKAEAAEEKEQPKTQVGPADIKAAAANTGAKQEHEKLNISEARVACKEVSKAKDECIAKIGDVFCRILTGELTPKMAISSLETILKGGADEVTPKKGKGKK